MHAQANAEHRTGQLSLNLSDGFFVPATPPKLAQAKRTITFPKHVTIPHFGAFQRQVNALFAPFGIVVEFSLSRQKRLQMTWVFPPETSAGVSKTEHGLCAPIAHAMLSDEEVNAFANVVFAFAAQPRK